MPVTLLERVLARCDRSGPCWVWQGATTNGYGRIRVAGVLLIVHRLVYELVVGPVPDGLDLDHLCRVRACCNPAHLEPVTRRENLLRGQGATARAHADACHRGHPFDEANTRLERTHGGRYTVRRCRRCDAAKARARRKAAACR